MKYHATDQVMKIIQLQNEAEYLRQKALKCLSEADDLTYELINEIGKRFVCDDILFEITHMAIGFGQPGNRDWLVKKETMPVIK